MSLPTQRGLSFVVAAVASASTALAQSCNQLVHVPSPNAGDDANFVLGVSALSVSEAWAVGRYRVGDGSELPLSMRWNGVEWALVPMPLPSGTPFGNVPLADLSSVRAFASDNVWAVGNYIGTESAAQETLAYRWNGSQWSAISSPRGTSGSYGSQFHCVDGASGSEVWAVGEIVSPGQRTQPLAARWTGTTWQEFRIPDASGGAREALKDLSVISANDIWALEGIGVGQPVNPKRVLRWNGSSWNEATTRLNSLRYGAAEAIHAFGPSDVWVSSVLVSTYAPVMLHWNGSTWTERTVPLFGSEFYANGPSDLYAAGSTGIMRWNGSTWTLVHSLTGFPDGGFFDVHRAADGTVWCAGTTMPGSGARTLMARLSPCGNPCPADFNADTVVDFFDYLDFVSVFASGGTSADFNADTVIDFFDYLDFVAAFAAGC